MKYICQIADGYMLAKDERYDDKLLIVNTGYPYPDTDKSNVEMFQSLMQEEKQLFEDINFYYDVFPRVKKYLMKYTTSGYSSVSIDDIYKIITEDKILDIIIDIDSGVYEIAKIPVTGGTSKSNKCFCLFYILPKGRASWLWDYLYDFFNYDYANNYERNITFTALARSHACTTGALILDYATDEDYFVSEEEYFSSGSDSYIEEHLHLYDEVKIKQDKKVISKIKKIISEKLGVQDKNVNTLLQDAVSAMIKEKKFEEDMFVMCDEGFVRLKEFCEKYVDLGSY